MLDLGAEHRAEFAHELLHPPDADGDFGEIAEVLLPEAAQVPCGRGQEVQEQALDAGAAAAQGVDQFIGRTVVAREHELREGAHLGLGGHHLGRLGRGRRNRHPMGSQQPWDDLGLERPHQLPEAGLGLRVSECVLTPVVRRLHGQLELLRFLDAIDLLAAAATIVARRGGVLRQAVHPASPRSLTV